MKPNRLIDTYLQELKDAWGYTDEELYDISEKMANYALAAVMDSTVRQEAESICTKLDK